MRGKANETSSVDRYNWRDWLRKSTVAKEIYNKFDEACIAMIEQDSYYKDQSSIPFEERCKKTMIIQMLLIMNF